MDPKPKPFSNRGGPRPNSGRKTNAVAELRRELDKQIAEAAPRLVAKLVELADGGDRPAAEYLLNRLLGKPTERHELSGPDGAPIPFETALARVYGDDGAGGGGG